VKRKTHGSIENIEVLTGLGYAVHTYSTFKVENCKPSSKIKTIIIQRTIHNSVVPGKQCVMMPGTEHNVNATIKSTH
jgi:hypothetical protein